MMHIENLKQGEIREVADKLAPIIVLSERTANLNFMESVMTSFGCKCDTATTDTALIDKIVMRTQSMTL